MTDTPDQASGFLARIARRAEELEAGGKLLDVDDVDLEEYMPRRPRPKRDDEAEARQRAESVLPRGDRTE
jgi:hypothetical protein